MKKPHLLSAVCAVLFSFITISANATLHGRLPLTLGGTDFQAAYDDVLDITWLTDAGLSGPNSWDNQVAWADSLNTSNHLGFNTGWRLASMSVAAGLPTGVPVAPVIDCRTATEPACQDNEVGYMFYHNMGGVLGNNKTGNQSVDGVLLTGVQPITWSGTEDGSSGAWYFGFDSGLQDAGLNVIHGYGWAVRAGDVSAVPAEEFGLDARPINATCTIADRPVNTSAVTIKTVVGLWGGDTWFEHVPVAMVQSPDDASRWFVLTLDGKVTEYSDGDTFSKVGAFLDITDRVTNTFNGQAAEFGALGIAFHPDFQQNGQVFIFYTAAGTPHVARLSKFTSLDNGATLIPGSEEILLSLNLTSQQHIGGNLAFGPDGYLYLGVGDGGTANNAQDLNSLMGKMLRIDVDSSYPYAIPADNPWASGGGRGEIYALGFRNPWRWSFDKVGGELWLGDVGLSSWEEIDRVVNAGNYGWPIREGAHCYGEDVCDTQDLIDPFVEYSHNGGSAAVIGGFVYRGNNIPDLQGVYIYIDQRDGRLWALQYNEFGEPQPEVIFEAGADGVFSLAEGHDGELYILGFKKINKLVYATPNPIFGLNIGGTPYDVTFHDGVGDSFNAIWDADDDGVFDGAAPTFWGNPAGASAAADAILAELGSVGESRSGTDGFLIPYAHEGSTTLSMGVDLINVFYDIEFLSLATDTKAEALLQDVYEAASLIPYASFQISETGAGVDSFPQKLSETGCTNATDTTKPAPGLIPYTVNAPLWSDGAIKDRWMALPDNQTIHINEADDWEFPVGTVLIKNFRLADKLIETRLLMRHLDGDWGGYSYEWNDSQTEAFLLPTDKTKTINGQIWTYPSRSQCMQCHTQVAVIALGLETAQLNGQFIYPSTGRQANQLATLDHIGMFDTALPDSVGNLPQLARMEDESQPVALRARAYLHANCSMCHQPGGPGLGPEDFRYTTAVVDIGAINVLPTQNDFQIADARLLSPGHPEKSIISYRMHTLDQGRMPPLGSAIVDVQGSNLIDNWILQIVDTDSDGIPDSIDMDDDNDGLLDADEATYGTNPLLADTDGDGFDDWMEVSYGSDPLLDSDTPTGNYNTKATLHGRLPLTPGGTDYQAAYDDVLDITWVTNASLGVGYRSWDEQVAWVEGLEYLGYDDWRLASMSVSAGLPVGTTIAVVECSSATELDCRDNELGYMYSYNLTPSGDTSPTALLTDLQGDQTVGDVTLTSIQRNYWSSTERYSLQVWTSFFNGGFQGGRYNKDSADPRYGWAVRDGDVLIDNGYTTIDPAKGLEWLDLTLTQGVSAQDVLAGFGGYIDAGWTFATVEQVCDLFGAMGEDTTNCTSGAVAVQMKPTQAETLVNLLGNTAVTGRGAYGMFNGIDSLPDNFGIACINDTATSCTTGGASSWLTQIEWGAGYTAVGSYLVREYIEPANTLIDNGDTTIDPASGLEWLDLTFTQGVSAQDVLDGFGGFLDVGWSFATVEQVCGLFGALGDDSTNCTTGAVAMQMNPTKSETLIDLLGNTAVSGRGAYGMFDNFSGFAGNFGLGCINDTATSCTTGGASSWLTQIEWGGGYTTVGSFLVREYTEYLTKQGVLSGFSHDAWDTKVYSPSVIEQPAGTWRMFYTAYGADVNNDYGPATATTTDFVTWTKPNIGKITWGGNTNNNLIIFRDVATPTPMELNDVIYAEGQFLALVQNKVGAISQLWTSPDGEAWTWNQNAFQGTVDGIYAEPKCILYDGSTYKIYYRANPGEGAQNRSLGYYESATYDGTFVDKGWLPEFTSTDQDRQFYDMEVWAYNGDYLASVVKYNKTTEVLGPHQLYRSGDNGASWSELGTMIRNGARGEFDHGFIAGGEAVLVGSEWHYIYVGSDDTHAIWPRTMQFGDATR